MQTDTLPLSRYLTIADALDDLYSPCFEPDSSEADFKRAEVYGMIAASLQSGELAGSDEEIADRIDEHADGFDERLTRGIGDGTDTQTMREIARQLRAGELIGKGDPALAAAAQWHREQEAACEAELFAGKVPPGDVYTKWAAKLETHRIAACHFDGYEASVRFERC